MIRSVSTAAWFLLCIFSVAASAEEPAAAPSATPAATPTVDELLAKAKATMAETQDYVGLFNRLERKGSKMIRQNNAFKFAKPFKVYLRFVDPFPGREVIYKRGWNDGELRVHKGSFPDVTVNLDPQGDTAMDRTHHPITQFGLDNTILMAEVNLKKAQKGGEGEIKILDGGLLFGQPVWKVEVVFPRGGYNTTAKDGETLWDIARRTGQDMYWIMHNNQDKDYDEPDDVDEGDKVFIPRFYGSKAAFYLNKGDGLPVKAEIWDRKGKLYERYEYPEIKRNVGLTAKDFDPDNPKYNF